jgi:hypothetical protein
MTASLTGVRLVSGRVNQASNGAAAETVPAGMTMRRRSIPLGGSGGSSQSATADFVFQVEDASAPTLQVCKGTRGGAHVTVDRVTQAPAQVASVDDPRTDGGTGAGCQNAVVTPVAASDLLGPAPWPQLLDPRRLTLAFYYPWYSSSSFDSGSWRDHPEQPWNTDDAGDVGRIVDQAKQAGVDGFVVSYQDNPAEVRRLDMLAQAAATRSSVVAPLFELDRLGDAGPNGREATLLRWFSDLLARARAPEYLKVGDRPVVFLYHAVDVTPDMWRSVLQQLSQQGANPFIVSDTAGPAYNFDGLYAYSPNRSSDDQLADFYGDFVQHTRFDPAVGNGDRQRLWAAPVSPGEDDSALNRPPNQKTLVDRRVGGRYDATWTAATATSPEWVLVTTWNEWFENTEIAPSARTGTRALDQTAAWSSAFHG